MYISWTTDFLTKNKVKLAYTTQHRESEAKKLIDNLKANDSLDQFKMTNLASVFPFACRVGIFSTVASLSLSGTHWPHAHIIISLSTN